MVFVGVAVLGLAVLGGYLLQATGNYEIKLVMRSAAQVVQGSPVWVDGFKAGDVSELETRDGKAVVTVALDDEYAPLHEGMRSRVEWKSVLGERIVTLYPGPPQNPEIPDGAMYEASTSQIELDQVLSALDKPTRARLSSLMTQLDQTLKGNEADLQSTIRSAGPTVHALGAVLEGVGRDGPAIRSLITQLRKMTATVAQRQGPMRETVGSLTQLTGSMAEQQKALTKGLAELPSTLRETGETLGRVPAAGNETVPLLKDLQPATAKLPSVARNLSPVLKDLRPTVARLRPTLAASDELLRSTPGLMDTAHGVLPPAQRALERLGPAINFLRPYTPEAAGWLTNWNTQFATYDSQGHMWSGLLAPGPSALNDNVVLPPPLKKPEAPQPGAAVGQPWTDANGSPPR